MENKRGLIFAIVLLGIFILFSLNFVSAFSGEGAGTLASPFNIANCTQLQEMNDNLTASYELVNDIDFNDEGCEEFITGEGFLPIGTASIASFSGNFNGNGYNITGLYINIDRSQDAGLFGAITGNLSNVGLINVNITSTGGSAGGLAGQFLGLELVNSFTTGIVVAAGNDVGGLVGYADGAIINNSYSTVSVTGNYTVGGLVGYFHGNILSSYATGNVIAGDKSGYSYAGGLVGYSDGTISSSYATGNVNATGNYVGGLTGDNYGTINHSYATGNVTGTDFIGGLVGYFHGNILSSYATGNVNATEGYVGGLVGYSNGTILSSYATGNVIAGDKSGYSYAGGLVGDNYGTINHSYATGNVGAEGDTVGGLVGYFHGNILSSYATGGVNGNNDIGGLVGDNYGTINHSYATGNVSGTDFIGGLVGYSNLGNNYNVTNSYATGNVNATGKYVGGLIGDLASGTIVNCNATGNVTGTDFIGGLVGYFHGNILSSYATGNVIAGDESGYSYAGGLVGYSDGTILSSYATGNVNATGKYVGGLVGDCYSQISNCYSRGDVSGANSVGGLVGHHNPGALVLDSYTTGNVYGTGAGIGGIAGYAPGGIVNNSFATGTISGEVIGGIIGVVEGAGVIENSYWYNNSAEYNCTGDSEETSCFAIDNTEYFYNYDNPPMNLTTKDGWDFTTIWDDVFNGTDYPILLWQNVSVEDTCTESWTCGDWSSCSSSGIRTRTCTDANQCETTEDKPAESQTCTYSSGSGGGYAPKSYFTDDKFDEIGNNFNMFYNDKIKFVVNLTNHTLTLNQFNSTSARVTIQSNPIVAYLQKGVLYEFDLNNDSMNDVRVRYGGLNNTKAMMFIQEIVRDSDNEVTGNAVDKSPNESEINSIKDSKYLILGISITLIIGVILFFIFYRRHKKKRYWMHGR